MQRPLLLLFLCILVISCKNLDKDEYNEFHLSGHLDADEAQSLTIEELTTSDLIIIDSIQTDDTGNFTYRQKIDDAGFYILRINRENFITLLIEPGEEIKISGKAENLPLTYTVEGSEGSKLLAKLNKRLNKNIAKVDSLADVYRASLYEPDFENIQHELNVAYTEIFENHKKYVKKFIKKNPHSLASIIALYQYFGDKVILNEHTDFIYFKKASKSLSAKYSTNKHVIELKKRVSDIKRRKLQREMAEEKLAIGNTAPEIALPDPEGNTISLSDLKGNVVLIDFWASWHDPCQKSNKKLVNIYDKYNERGFEIYGISLDRTREQWLKAINKHDMEWIQVSDLRFFNSPVVSLYNIKDIPYTVLVGRDGNIVAKDIDHVDLDEQLEELL